MKQKEAFGFPAGACVFAIVAVLIGYQPPDARGAGLITGGIPLQLKQTQYCSVFVPSDWTFWTDPSAMTAEALSSDGTMYSGWAMIVVDKAMRPVYGDLFGDPQLSIQVMTNRILWNLMGDSSKMRYTSYLRPFLNFFTLNYFESSQNSGLVFYRIYPGTSPEKYIESVYWAIARKSKGQEGFRTAAGVTISIRCLTQSLYLPRLQASPMSVWSGRPGCGAGEALGTYQKELGIQYAHSPGTGQNFLVEPSTQWNATGPQGPGYYQRAGNGYEKLELGWNDGC